MDQLLQIFTAKFLFNPTPPVRSDYYIPFLITFAVLVGAALVILIFVKGEPRKFLRTLITPFLTVGILGLIHLASRYERLPWLASRFFLALVIATFMVWMIAIAVWLANYLPEYKSNKLINEKFNKYLPGENQKSPVSPSARRGGKVKSQK